MLVKEGCGLLAGFTAVPPHLEQTWSYEVLDLVECTSWSTHGQGLEALGWRGRPGVTLELSPLCSGPSVGSLTPGWPWRGLWYADGQAVLGRGPVGAPPRKGQLS